MITVEGSHLDYTSVKENIMIFFILFSFFRNLF